jgi:thiol:disulfide interchange protein/DsbC/DsbD-like thiol-disulfide interchange protein
MGVFKRMGHSATRWWGMVLLGCWLSASVFAQSFLAGAVVKTDQVRAELLAHAPQGVQPGKTFWLGLQITHQPHWHTYWQNPGDSGLPTQLSWTLPAGLQAGAIDWPLPKKIPIGTLANYGYEGSMLLSVPITVAANATLAATLPIQLKAEWLVCRQECIPQEGTFNLQLPVSSATALNSAVFDAAQKARTTALKGAHSATLVDAGQTLALRAEGLPASWQGQTLSLFPVTGDVVKNSAEQGTGWTQQWQGPIWTARVPVSSERGDSPNRMRWVIARGAERNPQAPAVEIDTPVQGAWPATSANASAALPPALTEALQANAQAAQTKGSAPSAATSAPPLTLGLALLGALVGGLILNLMPCVFPVLAIKVLGFSRPGTSARAHRASGLAYTAGVVLSFVLLGALLMTLRAAGEQLGWGFQLQSPLTVSALAVLFTLLGLNLAGLFEFGQLLPSAVINLQSRHPMVDAALSGVLAVAIASPCTAPFMGASMGLAIGLPLWQALPVFAAMGLGMALPYLGASLWPALAHRLPRPGAWMATFRQAMAFPMFATVVWLVWVLGQQTGVDGSASLLALLVALAALVWALGLQGSARAALGLLALVALLWLGWSPLRHALQEPAAVTASSTERWNAWSAAEVTSRQAQGQTVFVDFTAAWCVTCQYNKKTTLADAQVLAALDAKNVRTLRADWTRRDPAITQALAQLGRSGVPVYAVYAPGKPAVVLSELPSVQEVLNALP